MIKNIYSWLFPYRPTEEDVRKFYDEGKNIFENMIDKERKEFLKPNKNLPLGL